jgi:hypothetical protein
MDQPLYIHMVLLVYRAIQWRRDVRGAASFAGGGVINRAFREHAKVDRDIVIRQVGGK